MGTAERASARAESERSDAEQLDTPAPGEVPPRAGAEAARPESERAAPEERAQAQGARWARSRRRRSGPDVAGAEPAHAAGPETEPGESDRVGPEAAEPFEARPTSERSGPEESGQSEPEAEQSEVAEPEARARGARMGWARIGSRQRLAAVAGLALAALLSGWLLYAAQALKDPAASGNHALTDPAATSQVTGEVSSALTRIFAYTPDDTQATAQAARDVLDGEAATQYQALFAGIRQQVTDQRLTLTTRVVRAGVVSLTGSSARLLVFLDQSAERPGETPTTAAAQLAVTARYEGGHWRITELTTR